MVSYQPLFDLLTQRNMKLRDVMLQTGIAPNTATKIRKNKEVSLTVLGKICEVFDEKMGRLTSELNGLFIQSHELENEIRKKLSAIGFEM